MLPRVECAAQSMRCTAWRRGSRCHPCSPRRPAWPPCIMSTWVGQNMPLFTLKESRRQLWAMNTSTSTCETRVDVGARTVLERCASCPYDDEGGTAGLKCLPPALETQRRSRTPTCSSWQAAVSASTSSSILQAQGRAGHCYGSVCGEARLCKWPVPKGCAWRKQGPHMHRPPAQQISSHAGL